MIVANKKINNNIFFMNIFNEINQNTELNSSYYDEIGVVLEVGDEL